MEIHFHKYQGTGNDFIIIDDRSRGFDRNNFKLVNRLCNRRFGIGADGLILLRNHNEYDFEMVYFNADGHEGTMCGNGGRCIVQFAHDIGVIQDATTFYAVDGTHEATIDNTGMVHLKMNDVSSVEENNDNFFMDTGSPHFISFVESLKDFDVFHEGSKIRYSGRFEQEGTNVNFVEKQSDNTLYVRTYERGVEDETYSCGTGVTACALAASFHHYKSPVNIKSQGGNLKVAFSYSGDHFHDIYLIGPATAVFKGSIYF